jgi:superfamily II DNA or RNA helicase
VSAIALLRATVARRCFRVALKLPTGAGKTVVAATIFKSAKERNPNARLLIIVDQLTLIDQTVDALYAAGLYDIGVIQADHPKTDPSKSIQVASVQTLRRRGMPPADLVIVDECHRQDGWLQEIMASEEWKNIPFIGLSATPWSKGLGNVYEELIDPVTMQELIDAGYLSPFKVFAAAHPDLTGIKTLAGDYHEGQLSERMQEGGLIADLIGTWKARGENRPTLIFCVDRAHAKAVQLRFEEAGIGCGYIDAYTDPVDRRQVKAQLDRGDIKAVANVACLTTGVDWAIGCIVLARPTKSEMLYVQMVGRGLRVNPGMDDCIILDHADNTLRLGLVTDIHHDHLCRAVKGERTSIEAKASLPKECPKCTFIKPPKVHQCPECGFKPVKRSEIQEEAGEPVEITKATAAADKAVKQSWLSQLNAIASERKYTSGWVSNTYRKKFGVWPRGLNSLAFQEPTSEVRNYVLAMNIRFAKRRQVA